MDKIQKALNRLNDKERVVAKEALGNLLSNNLQNLDIKKLKSRDDIFRIRKGRVRIIYRMDHTGKIFILKIERRSETTHNL